MEITIQLRLIDSKTKKVWETENHNKDKKKDDYHREIKPAILADLSPSLKKIFGENCDVAIRDGAIYIVPQEVNGETGKKSKVGIKTDLKAEDYFNNVSKLIIKDLIDELLVVLDTYGIERYKAIEVIYSSNAEHPEGYVIVLELNEV